jgi:hypothetical protein
MAILNNKVTLLSSFLHEINIISSLNVYTTLSKMFHVPGFNHSTQSYNFILIIQCT